MMAEGNKYLAKILQCAVAVFYLKNRRCCSRKTKKGKQKSTHCDSGDRINDAYVLVKETVKAKKSKEKKEGETKKRGERKNRG